MKHPTKCLVSVERAAAMLGASESEITQAIQAGELPAKIQFEGMRNERFVLLADNVKSFKFKRKLAAAFDDSREAPFVECLPCIYFLMRDSAVVYIGKTTNLMYRIGQHLHAKRKRFDTVRYVSVDMADLDLAERHLIHDLQPEYNCQHASTVDL